MRIGLQTGLDQQFPRRVAGQRQTRQRAEIPEILQPRQIGIKRDVFRQIGHPGTGALRIALHIDAANRHRALCRLHKTQKRIDGCLLYTSPSPRD